jgi:hypothetical protein
MGKPEGRRTLGRQRYMWVHNIKMDFRYDGVVSAYRSDTGQGPVEGSCEHSTESSGSVKCWQVLE